MKFTLILLAVFAITNAAHVDNIAEQSISSTIVDAIEGMKEQMPCGFPGLGIPPVAPLRINHKEVNIDTPALMMRGTINHFRLNGLNEFDIDDMKVNPITSKVTYKFNFRDVNVDTSYDMEMMLKKFGFTINIVGKGHAKFAIRDMSVWGTIKYSLGVLTGKLKLKTLEVRTHIGEVDSEIEGIMGDGSVNHMMNTYLEEAVEVIINENEDLITEQIENAVVPVVNSVLEDVSISDMISNIGGGEGGEKEVCIPPEIDW